MKKPAVLVLLAAIGASCGVARAADADAGKPGYSGSPVTAERRFGDVRFVLGAGKSTNWLQMYVDGNHIAGFENFLADEVIASPDGRHFLALSNSSKSAYAFAILDRNGQIEASRPHGGDLHYCNRTAWGIGEWADTSKPQATFSMEKNELASPATSFLFATVRGCDGRTVVLSRPSPPSLKATPRTAQTIGDASNNGQDRSAFFIGNAIQNLRDQDPNFAGRTLTLVDGRRLAAPTFTYKTVTLPAEWSDGPVSERRSCIEAAACSVADLVVNRADGSTQVLATNVTGDFIALPGSHRIFACGYGASTRGRNGPVVVDLQGNRTSLPAHSGPLRICARTGTGNEVLLVYTLADAGKAFTLARVYDAGGTLLAEGSFEKEGSVQFKVAGKPYSATVPGP
jgi:hypothetical protein